MADREERGLLGLDADNARLGDILETRGCRHGKFSWWKDLWLGGKDSCPFDEGEGESNVPENVPSSHEGAKRMTWLGVRDDFRNWVGLGLKARKKK